MPVGIAHHKQALSAIRSDEYENAHRPAFFSSLLSGLPDVSPTMGLYFSVVNFMLSCLVFIQECERNLVGN